jgi:hypothetical protein
VANMGDRLAKVVGRKDKLGIWDGGVKVRS